MSKKSIFVSIPSMNDREYLHTVKRLFDSATYPERIFLGSTIFWKKSDISEVGAPFFYHFDQQLSKIKRNIKYDILYWNNYPGVGFGRTEPLKHYNNEDYYLSLDSHTMFVKGWDEKVIDAYENAKKSFGRRLVLTSYLAPYYIKYDKDAPPGIDKFLPGVDGLDVFEYEDIVFEQNDNDPRWQFFDYTHFRYRANIQTKSVFPYPNDVSLNVAGQVILPYLIDEMYLPAKKISAHFTFTEADPWVTKFNLNLDTRISFWLEEFYQSSLAYARGYNFVWTKETFFFHKYLNSHNRLHDQKYEYDSMYKKRIFYEKYIKTIENKPPLSLDENEIIKKFLNKEEYFGFLSRSPISFQKYSGVNLEISRCEPWWKVPKVDIIYK